MTNSKKKIQNKPIAYVDLLHPHPFQKSIRQSKAKRIVVRAGRRSGKTVIAASICVEKFVEGLRPLYATPTSDQLETFWFEVKKALEAPIAAGLYKKNETEHTIENEGTKARIKGKTAWNSDMLRGDYSDYLVLDEFQLMNENTWEVVGAPMLLDNDGDAMIIYTPLPLHGATASKARDPRYAQKLFKAAQQDTTGRWQAFHFTSFDNPFISHLALNEITHDMTSVAYRQEILAEDVEEVPGALWTRKLIDSSRITEVPKNLQRIVIGVDPPGGLKNECGIVVAGITQDGHEYILDDATIAGTPGEWSTAVIDAYQRWQADCIIGETNYGGLMVEQTIAQTAKEMNCAIRYQNVSATRGKAVRAEPVVALYEHRKVHHVCEFPALENEQTLWVPGESNYSPNRVDALVWACIYLVQYADKSRPIQHNPIMPLRVSRSLRLD